MAAFIALAIMKAADKNLEQGKTRYRAYFVNTTLYTTYKTDADTILQTTTSDTYPDGYEECIVTE